MITLTDNAANYIKNTLEKNPQSKGFRLSIKKTGCSGYAYSPELIETIDPEDIQVIARDNLLIYLDSKAIDILKNITIDYGLDMQQQEKNALLLKQKKLIFINPQEKNRCGCGESFTIT